MKKNLILIFGGKSTEHDISIITANIIYGYIDENKYNIIPIYITKNNQWISSEELFIFENYSKGFTKYKNVLILPNSKELYEKRGKKLKKIFKVDVAVISMHGINGEDGTVSGLLELSEIPYINSSVLGSAITLNKVVFKHFLNGLKIPNIEFINLFENEYYANIEKSLKNIENLISYPLIVKPNCLGSSIGIAVCKNVEELKKAIETAFDFDDEILIEKFLSNIQEINFALYKKDGKFIYSLYEEPLHAKDILDFNEKYLDNYKKSGIGGVKKKFPVKISKKFDNQIKKYSTLIYTELKLNSIVRLDFIIDKDTKTLYLNELNSIPGSFAIYLFNDDNFFSAFDAIITDAIHKNYLKTNKTLFFNSSVLKNYNSGQKK